MPSITDDTRISSLKELAAPSDLLNQIPLDETVAAHVTQARGAIHNVLAGDDDRLAVGLEIVHVLAALGLGHAPVSPKPLRALRRRLCFAARVRGGAEGGVAARVF